MSSFDTLPVVLVSAADEAAASAVIAEIIDNESSDIQNEGNNTRDRLWRIVNKYYTADVRFHPYIDGDQLLLDPDIIEGHIIYLAETECTVEVASGRAERAGAAGARASVRLVLARVHVAPPALCAWAAAARLDLVPLSEAAPAPAPGPAAPFPELSGIPRARAALHAHAWRGLRSAVRGPLDRVPRAGRTSSESSAGSAEEGGAEEEEAAVERAERFAAALGALAGAAPHAAALRGLERRLAAERLVAEFCRALGRDLDAC